MRRRKGMERKQQDRVALHRWAVIAEAANDRLTAAERGALVRQIAARAHTHPDGSARRYSRGTIDRWLRAWRAGGLEALKSSPRADTGVVRARPELFAEAAALRLELPGRSAAQIASILYHRHGIRVAERTIRAQLRRAGLHREALAAEPKAYGRYEAARCNERWITDVLVGPWVPWPRREGSVRARLFLIVGDHSRLLVDGRFFAHENARACQELLRRAITRRGVPDVLYCDNGAPFSNAWLARTCGVLGIRLVHSRPYSPPLTGQWRLSLPGLRGEFLLRPGQESLRESPACPVDYRGSVRVTHVPCLIQGRCRWPGAGNAGGSTASGGPPTCSCATTTSATWPTAVTRRPASAATLSTCCTSPAGWPARTSAWTPWAPMRCCVTWPLAVPSAAKASTTT